MGKEILTFEDIEIEKKKNLSYLSRFLWVKKNDKYFIGYLYNVIKSNH